MGYQMVQKYFNYYANTKSLLTNYLQNKVTKW